MCGKLTMARTCGRLPQSQAEHELPHGSWLPSCGILGRAKLLRFPGKWEQWPTPTHRLAVAVIPGVPAFHLWHLHRLFYLRSCRLQPAHPPLTFTKAGLFAPLVCDVRVFPQEWSCASPVPGFSLNSLSCVTLAFSGYLYCDQPQFSPWGPVSEPWDWVPRPTHCRWAWGCEPLLGWEVLFDKNLCCEFSALYLEYLLLHLSIRSPLRCGNISPALPLRGFPSVWKHFFLRESLPWVHPLGGASLSQSPLPPFLSLSFAIPHSEEIALPFWKSQVLC